MNENTVNKIIPVVGRSQPLLMNVDSPESTVYEVDVAMLQTHPWEKDIFGFDDQDGYEKLKQDIQERGLKTPIHITNGEWIGSLPPHTIIAGHRRARVFKELGKEKIPTQVLSGFGDEWGVHEQFLKDNVLRRQLDKVEQIKMADKILEVEQHKAKERQGTSTGGKEPQLREILPEGAETGRARDFAAKKLGISGKTLENNKKAWEYIQKSGDAKLEQDFRLDRIGSATILKQAKVEEFIATRKKAVRQPTTGLRLPYSLYFGDARVEIDELEDESVDCVVTDPPYGLEVHNTRRGGKDYVDGVVAYELLDEVCAAIKPKLKKDAHLWVFSASGALNTHEFYQILKKHFWVFEIPLVWETNNHTMCDFKARPALKHESVFFCKNGEGRLLNESVTPTVLHFDKTGGQFHSAEKPVALLEYLVKNSTIEGEVVCDPFMGSGSTGVAAVATKRQFCGFEIEKKYYDIADARVGEIYAKKL